MSSGAQYGISEATYAAMARICMEAKGNCQVEPCAIESLACGGCLTTLYGRNFSFGLRVIARPKELPVIALEASRLDVTDESFQLLYHEPDTEDTWRKVLVRMWRVDNCRRDLSALPYVEVADVLCKRGLLA